MNFWLKLFKKVGVKMSIIKIKNPGPLTTVQDKGRYGYQKYGMPVAGVMDAFSYKMANLLVGNEENEAVLEFTFQGPKIEFKENSIIAITGADAQPCINDRQVSMWESLYVEKGSTLSFSGLKSGFRGYISFKSGIKVPEVMGSKSTYLRGGLGGFAGRKLEKGDSIEICSSVEKGSFKERYLPQEYVPVYSDDQIRVILGPQEECFTEKGLNTFLSETFQITSQADRMGYRLEGATIEHETSADILSDGIAPGSIQVPGHGKPIVMLADRQTTGGYTKIATVITVDINKIVQMKPGSSVDFAVTSQKKAEQLLKKQKSIYNKIKNNGVKYGPKKKLRIKIDGQNFETEIEEIYGKH
jgi:biotin-dependent carboxylase-like uncharacterized protein